MNTFLH